MPSSKTEYWSARQHRMQREDGPRIRDRLPDRALKKCLRPVSCCASAWPGRRCILSRGIWGEIASCLFKSSPAKPTSDRIALSNCRPMSRSVQDLAAQRAGPGRCHAQSTRLGRTSPPLAPALGEGPAGICDDVLGTRPAGTVVPGNSTERHSERESRETD